MTSSTTRPLGRGIELVFEFTLALFSYKVSSIRPQSGLNRAQSTFPASMGVWERGDELHGRAELTIAII